MNAEVRDRAPAVTSPLALDRWRRATGRIHYEVFRPHPQITISEWADRERVLSAENSAEPGPWRTSRTPYLREVMDTITDPEVRDVVFMKCARIGYTEGVIGNTIGYYIDQAPCPILVVQPSKEDAEDWSKTMLRPMLDATPALEGKVADVRVRDSGNTILQKSFPGGYIMATGATSPKGLRRKTAKVGLFDEVDGYGASAGNEGDPIKLGEKRLDTFPDRKSVKGSTPLLKGFSRIEAMYENSDQRVLEVPCPHCGEFQTLKWGGPDKPFGIKWEREERDGELVHLPETAAYLCEHCGTLIEEYQKPAMVEAHRWVPQNPGHPTVGFRMNQLYSLFDGARWENLVREWLEAKGNNELLQVFVNTVLGETWEERGDTATADLPARAEVYTDHHGDPVDVPAEVGVLTAGVDVQGDRLEILIRGWGRGFESWMIGHHRIYLDPDTDEAWAALEAIRSQTFRNAAGNDLRISSTLVDASYNATEVYKRVKPLQPRGVHAVKGVPGWGKEPVTRAARKNRSGVNLVTLAVDELKRSLMNRLNVERPGPRYMHFCGPTATGADANFYDQFTAEKLVPMRQGRSRKLVRVWKQVKDRNEAIDLEVYAHAALLLLGDAYTKRLDYWVEQANRRPEPPTPVGVTTPRNAATRSRRPSGWVNQW